MLQVAVARKATFNDVFVALLLFSLLSVCTMITFTYANDKSNNKSIIINGIHRFGDIVHNFKCEECFVKFYVWFMNQWI